MFVKFSNCSIIGTSVQSMGRVAARKALGSFEYDDRGDGYLYVSVRACTADVPNLNFDMLPHSELKTAYRTFVGKPVYVNHANSNLDRARGYIIDAVYHDEDPDDRWIEILMEMDEATFPKLCALIRSGDIDTVSMGLNCESTTCSVCGNVAEQPAQFCNHIRQKGRTFDGVLAYEICNQIGFFEESWVYDPADPTATVQALENEARIASAKTAGRKKSAASGEWVDGSYGEGSRQFEVYDDDDTLFSGVIMPEDGEWIAWMTSPENLMTYGEETFSSEEEAMRHVEEQARSEGFEVAAALVEGYDDDDDDDDDTFCVEIYINEYDFDGNIVPNRFDDVYESFYYSTLEEAKAAADNIDPNDYVEIIEAGPLKAATTKVLVSVMEEDGNILYDKTSDSDLKMPYDARDELVAYVMSRMPGDPDYDLSFAPGSWETFYVQWRGLDINDEMYQTLDDADVKPYCKVRVSNHEPSYNSSFSEPTGYVTLERCRSFDAVADSVLDEYERWKSEVASMLGEEVFGRMAGVRAVTALCESGELAEGAHGDGSYRFEVIADNMVNKLRIPEEIDMQNSDRVCPICGSPDFDGAYCDVCEYVEYAEGFGDIDTELAQDNKEDRKELDEDDAPNEETDDADERGNEDDGRVAARTFDLPEGVDESVLADEGYAVGIDYDFANGGKVASYSVSLDEFLRGGAIQDECKWL